MMMLKNSLYQEILKNQQRIQNMSHNNDRVSIKSVLLCCMKIQLSIWISLIIGAPCLILIRMYIDDRIIQDLIFGILGVVIEFLILLFMFSKDKANDKSLSCSFMIKNTSFALIPHFIISLCFQFYIYAVGIGVNTLARVWGSVLANKYLIRPEEVPFYTYFVLMIPMMVLIVLSAYLGFKRGDKIIQKERNKLFKENDH